MSKLPQFENQNLPFVSRLADKVAKFGSSWKFIISFLFFMLIWIALNLFFLEVRFDPYPFILLNLLLSTEAALQTPIIMINLKAEIE